MLDAVGFRTTVQNVPAGMITGLLPSGHEAVCSVLHTRWRVGMGVGIVPPENRSGHTAMMLSHGRQMALIRLGVVELHDLLCQHPKAVEVRAYGVQQL
jgi:hypothetical protein